MGAYSDKLQSKGPSRYLLCLNFDMSSRSLYLASDPYYSLNNDPYSMLYTYYSYQPPESHGEPMASVPENPARTFLHKGFYDLLAIILTPS